jgi:L-histidine Nalpha-methyltransferase
MSQSLAQQVVSERLQVRPIPPARSLPSLRADAREGLVHPPRTLPPKYFYDARGSALFDQICDTPEYYLTRAEDELLARNARAIIGDLRPQEILEFGSGTSRKTRHLLNACGREECYSAYAPFDVCPDVVVSTSRGLVEDYDWLTVTGLVGDYCAGLDHLPDAEGARLLLFLGSTVGNFSHDEGVAFLREMRGTMGPEDRLLLGVDRVKAPEVLHAAYNDSAGITAQFNLNLLQILNRELAADFDPRAFEHYAYYDPVAQQVEMYIAARRRQSVFMAALDEVVEFAQGDAIRTEISRKFTSAGIAALLDEAGFAAQTQFDSDAGCFSLVLARVR